MHCHATGATKPGSVAIGESQCSCNLMPLDSERERFSDLALPDPYEGGSGRGALYRRHPNLGVATLGTKLKQCHLLPFVTK